MNIISSKNNNNIKDLIKLRDDSKFRNDKSLFYVEGERIVNDTPIELVDSIYVTETKVNNFQYILDKYNNDKIYVVNDAVYSKIKDTVNSQGIIAVVKFDHINKISDIDFKKVNSILVLDAVKDPGNLGTIIRLSEAANIDLIILANECCNLYNTKVIRSCMSSIFRKKIYVSNNIVDDINLIKDNQFKIYSSVLKNNSKIYSDIKYDNKFVIVVGNEANGISNDIINISDELIYIPMAGEIESLNVSVATSIICYEAMRQNNYGI